MYMPQAYLGLWEDPLDEHTVGQGQKLTEGL